MTPLIVETSFLSTHQAGVILTLKGIPSIPRFDQVDTLLFSVESDCVRIFLSQGSELVQELLVKINKEMHSILINSEVIKSEFYFIAESEGYETILIEKSLVQVG